MIARLWRTQVDLTRLAEYEQFAQEQSLPMFRQQQGFLGVFFSREHQHCLVLSLWKDRTAVEALATSATYQTTVRQLQATGLLLGHQSVELFEVSGGALLPAILSQVEHPPGPALSNPHGGPQDG
jgi:heme-degrading monooxygenase HmoA